MRKKTGVFILTVVLLMLGACSADRTGKSASMPAENAMAFADTAAEEAVEAEEEMKSEMGDAGAGSSVQAVDQNRKLIKYQDYAVETKEFDQFVEKLNQMVTEAGGYVEYSEVYGNDYGNQRNRSANYTLRIPVKGLDNFKSEMHNMGNVTRQSERVEDVTLNYIDTESHITALKSEQESLMEMLKKADDLEAIIAIQNRLTEVRYQLESYESQIRTYDNAIEYSTVNLYLEEVERESVVSETFGEKLKERFSESLYDLKDGFVMLALMVLGGIPYWILLAVVILIVVFIVKKGIEKE